MTEAVAKRVQIWAATDVGRIRAENEDCVGAGEGFLLTPSGRLDLELELGKQAVAVVVADGVGGSRGGKMAAGLAVTAFLSRCGKVTDGNSLAALIQEVSDHVRLACSEDPAARGGSTTLAGVIFTSLGGIAFNVGDSRVYSMGEQGVLTCLTRDHVSSADTRVLTRFLGGGGGAAHPHYQRFDPVPGGRFLVCTDGLFGPIPETLMSQLASIPGGAGAVEALLAAVQIAGAPDNVTVAVCDIA
jgi:PPM family protein phosphatase